MTLWTPNFYMTDSKDKSIKGSKGKPIKCSDKKFESFICLHEDDLYELYKQCSK